MEEVNYLKILSTLILGFEMVKETTEERLLDMMGLITEQWQVFNFSEVKG